jgi:hypothetical protein
VSFLLGSLGDCPVMSFDWRLCELCGSKFIWSNGSGSPYSEWCDTLHAIKDYCRKFTDFNGSLCDVCSLCRNDYGITSIITAWELIDMERIPFPIWVCNDLIDSRSWHMLQGVA